MPTTYTTYTDRRGYVLDIPALDDAPDTSRPEEPIALSDILRAISSECQHAELQSNGEELRALALEARETLLVWIEAQPVDRVSMFEALDRAKAILRDRGTNYGDADVVHGRTAALWSELMGKKVTSEQVVLCLLALKMARITVGQDGYDSWQDVIGYAAIGVALSTRSGR